MLPNCRKSEWKTSRNRPEFDRNRSCGGLGDARGLEDMEPRRWVNPWFSMSTAYDGDDSVWQDREIRFDLPLTYVPHSFVVEILMRPLLWSWCLCSCVNGSPFTFRKTVVSCFASDRHHVVRVWDWLPGFWTYVAVKLRLTPLTAWRTRRATMATVVPCPSPTCASFGRPTSAHAQTSVRRYVQCSLANGAV
jgi:hypothetical protein